MTYKLISTVYPLSFTFFLELGTGSKYTYVLESNFCSVKYNKVLLTYKRLVPTSFTYPSTQMCVFSDENDF